MKKGLALVLFVQLIFSTPVHANKFVEFAKSHLNERGITQCDAAVEAEFETAGGEDMRVNTDLMQDNYTRMTATWGSEGDAVKLVATMLIKDNSCKVFSDSHITVSDSCTAHLASMEAFEYVAEAPDYIWSKNDGGAKMLLTPTSGGGCSVHYQSSGIY